LTTPSIVAFVPFSQPRIEYAGTIEQGRHFEVADFQAVEARHLIMVLGCSSESRIRSTTELARATRRAAAKSFEFPLNTLLLPR